MLLIMCVNGSYLMQVVPFPLCKIVLVLCLVQWNVTSLAILQKKKDL